MRYVIAPLRVLLLLLHVVDGVLITGLIYPFIGQPARNRIKRAWARMLLWLAGVRVTVSGLVPERKFGATGVRGGGATGVLLLVNHVSWIDIFALDAVLPSRFVAKAEIARWPLLGQLVTLVGTLYIERGRRHAVALINHKVRDRLLAGEAIALFPEGTTTDGTSLLPFHSNLIAPAFDANAEVWPVALRYTERGEHTTAAAFAGDTTLVECAWNILVARDLAVDVAFLAPIATGPHVNRHHVAHEAHVRIAAHLGVAPAPARAHLRTDRASSRPETACDPATRGP